MRMLLSNRPVLHLINYQLSVGATVAAFPTWAPEALKANLALVDLLREWVQPEGVRPAQIALAWLLAQKPWIVPIPGTTQLPHLEENLSAVVVQLTADDLREINAAAAKIALQGARLPRPSLELTRCEAPLPKEPR